MGRASRSGRRRRRWLWWGRRFGVGERCPASGWGVHPRYAPRLQGLAACPWCARLLVTRPGAWFRRGRGRVIPEHGRLVA
jgi:hypothetical protein